jgi:hypothetical protein
MRKLTLLSAFAVALALPALAADPAKPSLGKVLDGPLSGLERELVPLVEAMPEAKMSFAPTAGEFKNARTFAQQATHIAYVQYAVAAAVLGEKVPSEPGTNENGPATLKTKADIVKYVKDSFAYAHRAMNMITAENSTEMVKSAFGGNQVPRISMATVALWHGFDHYGQMAVYSRMNSIIPPASRQ